MNQEHPPYQEYSLTPDQIAKLEPFRKSIGLGEGAYVPRSELSMLLGFFESEIAETEREKELVRKISNAIDKMDGVR